MNVDTFSLASQARGDFFGWVERRNGSYWKTSGAQATVTNVRLVSDLSATLLEVTTFQIQIMSVSQDLKLEQKHLLL